MRTIKYKDHYVMKSCFVYTHDLLVDLFLWVVEELYQTGQETVVTCGHEKRDYVSVHDVLPCRGRDIRSSNMKNPKQFCDYVNANWAYDLDRPHYRCAIYHNVGRGAHIHLQVCDNTIKRLRKAV
jgi:hypothetical protein